MLRRSTSTQKKKCSQDLVYCKSCAICWNGKPTRARIGHSLRWARSDFCRFACWQETLVAGEGWPPLAVWLSSDSHVTLSPSPPPLKVSCHRPDQQRSPASRTAAPPRERSSTQATLQTLGRTNWLLTKQKRFHWSVLQNSPMDDRENRQLFFGFHAVSWSLCGRSMSHVKAVLRAQLDAAAAEDPETKRAWSSVFMIVWIEDRPKNF